MPNPAEYSAMTVATFTLTSSTATLSGALSAQI
jgi:hypothetical protein